MTKYSNLYFPDRRHVLRARQLPGHGGGDGGGGVRGRLLRRRPRGGGHGRRVGLGAGGGQEHHAGTHKKFSCRRIYDDGLGNSK